MGSADGTGGIAPTLRIVATLPAEEALVLSGRLDERGIPASLQRAGRPDEPISSVPFHVLVSEEHERRAKSFLNRRRDPAHTRGLMITLIVMGIALGLSALMLAARWFFSGSPFPR